MEEEDGYNRLGTYERTAEIQLQQLHIRLSYHDWLVFQKIVDSFPKQATDAFEKRIPVNVDHQLNQLTSLGDCRFSFMNYVMTNNDHRWRCFCRFRFKRSLDYFLQANIY